MRRGNIYRKYFLPLKTASLHLLFCTKHSSEISSKPRIFTQVARHFFLYCLLILLSFPISLHSNYVFVNFCSLFYWAIPHRYFVKCLALGWNLCLKRLFRKDYFSKARSVQQMVYLLSKSKIFILTRLDVFKLYLQKIARKKMLFVFWRKC